MLLNDGTGHFPERIELPHATFNDGHTRVFGIAGFDINADEATDLLMLHVRNDRTLEFYGRCFVDRRRWRRSAGAMQAGRRPPAVGGAGREGGRAAPREDRRRRSTGPATPGTAEAHLSDVDAPVTTNPGWPDTPRRRRGGRSVACCLRGSGDTAADRRGDARGGFAWVLERLSAAGLLREKTVGVDATPCVDRENPLF